MCFRTTLSPMWTNIQLYLFPDLEQRTGPLSQIYKKLTAILELVRIEEYIGSTYWWYGRPPKDKPMMARAFIAKIVLGINYTKDLIQRLEIDKQLKIICGWESYSKIPSESKFSRVFKEFAETSLPEKAHRALISGSYKDRMVGHIIKDSTPITAREKGLKKEKSKERKNKLNQQYIKEKKEGTSRKQRQIKQSLDEMVEELPIVCDYGRKKNAEGISTIWKGYKLHIAVDDHCIPIATVLTSASLNDSEAAIPLAEKANRLVKNFYDVSDSAYDVKEVKEHSVRLGHIPIFDKHPRSKVQKAEKEAESKRKKLLNFKTAEDKRYKIRFPKERSNALLKDHYGGRQIYYKGHSKIFCHLSFGILAMTATMLLSFIN